jgi:hypothetical protein
MPLDRQAQDKLQKTFNNAGKSNEMWRNYGQNLPLLDEFAEVLRGGTGDVTFAIVFQPTATLQSITTDPKTKPGINLRALRVS